MNRSGLRLDQAPPLHLPLRFFLGAPLFGILAGLLLLGYGAQALSAPWAYATVALTHLITLGVLTQVMTGALYQITPVLIGSQVPWPGFARLVHLGLCAGVAALAGGLLLGEPSVLAPALVLLAPAFLIFLTQMTLAIVRAPSWNTTVASVAVSVASLGLAVVLGLVMLWEYTFGWLALGRWTLTTAHLYLALGGWVGALITGVGQAVIPMFYLAKTFPQGVNRLVLACQVLMLVTGLLVSALAPSAAWHAIPLGFGAVAAVAFCGIVYRQIAGRKRKVVDTTMRFWWVGIASAPIALGLLVVSLAGGGPRWLLGFGLVYLLGFAGSIIFGMLYKIVPFLIWLHRFSALAGKVKVPFLKDIIPDAPTRGQWRWHMVMLVLLLAASLSGQDLLVRLAGLAVVLNFGKVGLILGRAAAFRPVLTEEAPPQAAGD